MAHQTILEALLPHVPFAPGDPPPPAPRSQRPVLEAVAGRPERVQETLPARTSGLLVVSIFAYFVLCE